MNNAVWEAATVLSQLAAIKTIETGK